MITLRQRFSRMSDIVIRPAVAADCPAMFELVQDLAAFEDGLDQVVNTPAQFTQDFTDGLFGALLAEANGQVVGMGLYYWRYSTWNGKILYLEDLMVQQQWQGQGIGKQLMAELRQ